MYLKLKNNKLYYEIYGEGTPVIMLHGYSLDHNVMKGSFETIFKKRAGYKRIYFDLPGMGKSPPKDWIKTSDDILRIVNEFINKIINGDDYILVSESYGSYIARGLISQEKSRIKACLFLCPLINPQSEMRNLPEYKVFLKDNEFVKSLSKDEAYEFQACVIQNNRVWKRFKKEIYIPLMQRNKVFLEKLLVRGYNFSFEVDKTIQVYDKPTIFIMGRQDVSTGFKDALELIENYPRATYAILDIAGHNLQIEQEKTFNYLVEEWLDRIEENL